MCGPFVISWSSKVKTEHAGFGNLFIGAASFAYDNKFICDNKVDFIVCVVDSRSGRLKSLNNLQFDWLKSYEPYDVDNMGEIPQVITGFDFEVKDDTWEDFLFCLSAILSRSFNAIIHCMEGRHRAALAALLFLWRIMDYRFEEAWKIVSRHRDAELVNANRHGDVDWLRSLPAPLRFKGRDAFANETKAFFPAYLSALQSLRCNRLSGAFILEPSSLLCRRHDRVEQERAQYISLAAMAASACDGFQ